jgi:hypothetical protein
MESGWSIGLDDEASWGRDFWLVDLTTSQTRRLTQLANNGRTVTFDITPAFE